MTPKKREPVAVITEDSEGDLYIEDGRGAPVRIKDAKPREVVVKRHRRQLPRKEA